MSGIVFFNGNSLQIDQPFPKNPYFYHYTIFKALFKVEKVWYSIVYTIISGKGEATIAEKPLHEGHRNRVRQRFLAEGLTHFERHQILEMLLFFGIPRKDTNEIAHRLLHKFGSLSGVMNASFEDLRQVEGMTDNAATLICFSAALTREYARDRQQEMDVLKSCEAMGEYAVPFLAGLDHEAVLLICMDSRYRVLHADILTHGTVNMADINTRLVMQRALRHNATIVVLAHNHPGGSPVPSYEDINTTKSLINALLPVGIKLADHIVVAGDGFTSMHNTPLWAPIFE